MSYMSIVDEARLACQNEQDCRLEIQQARGNIDSQLARDNVSTIAWGILFVLIGVVIILTPFSKTLQKLYFLLLPKLLVMMPVVAGLVVGFIAGFVIGFPLCFGQDCAPAVNFLPLILSGLSLFGSVPIAIHIYRKQKNTPQTIHRFNTPGWLIVGGLLIVFTITQTSSAISRNNSSADRYKNYLQEVQEP